MKFTRYAFALLAVAMLTGCAHIGLDRPEVIGVAKRVAEQAGHRLADYNVSVAPYWLSPEKGSWEVFFHLKEPMPGGDFSVIVDDRTATAQVRGGM